MIRTRMLAAVAAASLAAGAVAATPGPAATVTLTNVTASATATSVTVQGRVAFSGESVLGTDALGDVEVPGLGHDLSELRLSQVGPNLKATLDIADPTAGDVARTNLYSVPLGSANKRLFAFRGPATWTYQVADFSSGYTSTPAQGTWDGTSVIWTVPTSTFGQPGDALFSSTVQSSQGAGTFLATLQLTSFVTLDQMSAFETFVVGGKVTATVRNGTQTVKTASAVAASNGSFTVSVTGLAPGDYTLEVSSAYGDATTVTSLPITVG